MVSDGLKELESEVIRVIDQTRHALRFARFAHRYGKRYETMEEMKLRYGNFLQSLELVKPSNSKRLPYRLVINLGIFLELGLWFKTLIFYRNNEGSPSDQGQGRGRGRGRNGRGGSRGRGPPGNGFNNTNEYDDRVWDRSRDNPRGRGRGRRGGNFRGRGIVRYQDMPVQDLRIILYGCQNLEKVTSDIERMLTVVALDF